MKNHLIAPIVGLSLFASALATEESGFAVRLKRAESGRVDDQIAVGCAYLDGADVGKDAARGLRWLNTAITARSAAAAYELASRHETGKGVDTNIDEAIRLYTLAGDGMSALAHRELGRLFSEGKTVTRDAEKAFLHLEMAVRLGYESLAESRDALGNELSETSREKTLKACDATWRRYPMQKTRIADLNRRVFGKKRP